jgi:hypothetical protein
MQGLKHPDDFERSWDQRRKAQIEVEDTETIGEVLTRGAEALGGEVPQDYPLWPFIDFYVEGRGIRFRRNLVLVDSNGHARWTYEWKDEPYGELIRARDAGALLGDPERIYILRQPGIGNGVLTDFPTWIELLRLAFEVGGAVALTKAGFDSVRRKLRSFKATADAVSRYGSRWRANGANAIYLWNWLRSQTWKSEDLARLLGTKPDEVESILESFGFIEEEDGTWSEGSDEESKLLAGNAEFILHSPHTERSWVESTLRERIEQFVETGVAPELDWGELPQMPVDPALIERTRVSEEKLHRLRQAGGKARYWISELGRRFGGD